MKSSFEGFPQPKKDAGGMKTGDATAQAGDIVVPKFAYGPSGKIIGSLPDNGANSFSPSTSSQPIPLGKYNGSGVINPVTGNAAAGDVKNGQGFSSASGIGQVGTMPIRNVNNVGTSISPVVGRLYIVPANGWWDGLAATYYDDPNFIVANLPVGMTLFGLTGTGGNVKRWATGTVAETGTRTLSGNYAHYITVTGLGFTPKTVYGYNSSVLKSGAFNVGDNIGTGFNWPYTSALPAIVNNSVETSWNDDLWYSGGFRLIVDQSTSITANSGTFRWIAIE